MNCLSFVQMGGVCLLSCLAVTTALAAPTEPAANSNEVTSIKGTYSFKGKESAWSAKLTAKGDGTYDAIYASSWNGAPLNYIGSIKSDLKTEISGTGKASGGKANGTFEFSGTFGTNGVAQCNYKEVGDRQRSGTLTIDKPK